MARACIRSATSRPARRCRCALDFDVPPEDGRYQVLRFAHARRRVLVLRARLAVPAGGGRRPTMAPSASSRVRVATASTLRRERRAARLRPRRWSIRSLTIWRNRGLIRVMVRRDILGRYRGSFGGAFWTVINPLLLMLTYFFVFGVVLHRASSRTRAAPGSRCTFWPACCPGWPSAKRLGRAPTVHAGAPQFRQEAGVRGGDAAREPGGLRAGDANCSRVVLFCGFLLALRGGVPAAVLWLPLLLVPQVLFTRGRELVSGGAGRLRARPGPDHRIPADHLVLPHADLLSGETSLAAHLLPLLLSKNPMYVLVRGYRAIFLENQAPAFGPLWKLWLLAAGGVRAGPRVVL